MTKQELSTLGNLLHKLQEKRLQEYRDAGYDVDSMEEDLMDMDSGDRLIQAIDTIFYEMQRFRED